MYPSVSLKIAPTTGINERPLGIALMETAQYDENGQKLIYYPQKAAENQVLLPGQSVPVLTRGIVTLTSRAIDDSTAFAVGSGFKLSANAGKVTGAAVSDSASLGTVLGTGVRGNNGATLADLYSGKFAVVKLGL
jgi:hypothetical protein